VEIPFRLGIARSSDCLRGPAQREREANVENVRVPGPLISMEVWRLTSLRRRHLQGTEMVRVK